MLDIDGNYTAGNVNIQELGQIHVTFQYVKHIRWRKGAKESSAAPTMAPEKVAEKVVEANALSHRTTYVYSIDLYIILIEKLITRSLDAAQVSERQGQSWCKSVGDEPFATYIFKYRSMRKINPIV